MVSIIVTAYNVAEWIEEAIASALAQTFSDIELVIVDDCSTDNTPELLSAIHDERVKIIRNEENLGAGASRRKGIEASGGEYILLLDGDDWIAPNFIEDLYTKAKESNAQIVSGGITIAESNGSNKVFRNEECEVTGTEKITRFWGENTLFMNNKLIHRSLHSKVPYCTRRYIEDTQVIVPMLYFANKVACVSNPGYFYRMHRQSLTHSATPLKDALFRALCANDIISFFEQHDKSMLTLLPLASGYAQCIREIKECAPTAKEIEPYKEEWIEFTAKLIGRLC